MKKFLRTINVGIFSAMYLFALTLSFTVAASEFQDNKRLAEQGFASAQYNLGLMYSKGDGVQKNNTEAVKWYRKAAEQGNAKAQFNLGVKYFHGEGVPENYIEAFKWWNLAAAQGVENAKKNKDFVRKKMTASQIEKAQELSSLFRPVKAYASSSAYVCSDPTQCNGCPDSEHCVNGKPRAPAVENKQLSEEKVQKEPETKQLVISTRQRQQVQKQNIQQKPAKNSSDADRLAQVALRGSSQPTQGYEDRRQLEEVELLVKMERDRNRRRAITEFDRHRGIIQQKVRRIWKRPSGTRPGLKTVALVNVGPNGDVISVRTVNGSGDSIFDQSVEDAIFKASPLPIPTDLALYEYFKGFLFELNPDTELN